MDITKICNQCNKILPINSFGLNNARPDHKQDKCRTCENEYSRKNRTTESGRKNVQNSKLKNALKIKIISLIHSDIRKALSNIDNTLINEVQKINNDYKNPTKGLFNIDEEYILQIARKQNMLNMYTETPIIWNINFGNSNIGDLFSSSIDRIDNNLGHVKGNVQIIESWINKMKLNCSHKIFN